MRAELTAASGGLAQSQVWAAGCALPEKFNPKMRNCSQASGSAAGEDRAAIQKAVSDAESKAAAALAKAQVRKSKWHLLPRKC
jgi:hypothetical protein